METFNNEHGLCVVLEREGDRALIALTYNPLTPFVIPLMHRKGERQWWHGHYCCTLEEAYEFWKEETNQK